MCGKPYHPGFRTMLHSDRVCRAVSRPQMPLDQPLWHRQRKSNDSRHPTTGDAEPARSVSGGFPRLVPPGVPDLSAYAYQEGVSLVPAIFKFNEVLKLLRKRHANLLAERAAEDALNPALPTVGDAIN